MTVGMYGFGAIGQFAIGEIVPNIITVITSEGPLVQSEIYPVAISVKLAELRKELVGMKRR